METTSTASEPTVDYKDNLSFWENNKILFKGFFIAFLILLMLIPSFFVQNLVHERASRKEEVIAEVSKKWGRSQTVNGPMIVIPYLKTEILEGNKTKQVKDFIYYLPDGLDIQCNISPENRHRSLYDVSLYKADVELKGFFKPNMIPGTGIAPQDILWKEAYVQLGLSDIKGLEKQINIKWDKAVEGDFQVKNFTDVIDVMPSGSYKSGDAVKPSNNTSELVFPIAFEADKAHDFVIDLHVKGSEELLFTPTGSQTQVDMHSTWKSPAFDGNYLPVNDPLKSNGFDAKWNIPQASRPYAQVNIGKLPDLEASVFGVKLLQPNDSYGKNERSAKYALLFVTLTFAVFFLMELLQKKNIHLLQYILVGFALILFYVLLLSISEYAGFNMAYAIAVTAIVLLIGLYVGAILNVPRTGVGFGLALSGLYGYIFFLTQLEDYALLSGSIGLFIILALIMYYTRKINWHKPNLENSIQ